VAKTTEVVDVLVAAEPYRSEAISSLASIEYLTVNVMSRKQATTIVDNIVMSAYRGATTGVAEQVPAIERRVKHAVAGLQIGFAALSAAAAILWWKSR
jgi:hypothetical protein